MRATVRNDNGHYVRFYTDGTAARKLPREVSTELSEPVKRKPLPVDIGSLCGIVICLLLLAAVFLETGELCRLNEELAQMELTVGELHRQNEILRTEYEKGYDLEEIQIAATALGMIPAEEAYGPQP